ncbi:uncharacterized protein N7500_000659 [Penicillium coprophilum]|uniref:uncharacterized protein n=1 Tax=Penicillium coprophilum TaxID=36646 RepID=UPI00238A5C3D|nr:uncharacterized protein N7500_000659 [Penicillium coprophilum]KAJ5177960.1 hypothetical protein N7500_000659 [Penicillium coprophilum]
MSRTLPKQFNPHILADAAPSYEELLTRRRLGKTNLSVKPAQIGTSNATKPENLGVFEYAHLRAPLPKDLEGSEIFPSHSPQQHPESYFLMRRSKDGFVSATGMFKIAFPWAKAEEERTEREYLKAREYTSEEEVAGNVWISPTFALELSKEYQMYEWVRALLDPTDIVQSPSSAKKQITPPTEIRNSRRGRSASPSKMSSARKVRSTRIMKDLTSTPSTTAANASLQSALDTASALFSNPIPELAVVDAETEVKSSGSPGKNVRARKSTRSATAEPEEETKGETKEKKKAEKKEKKKEEIKEEQEEAVEVSVADDAADIVESTHTTVSLDMPISLPEVPSAAETAEMIAQAKDMVEEAIKAQAEGTTAESTSVKVTKKRKSEDDDDEETSAESSQRAKKAKVLENKLKQERVRNRSIFGVSVAFALAASIPYFF